MHALIIICVCIALNVYKWDYPQLYTKTHRPYHAYGTFGSIIMYTIMINKSFGIFANMLNLLLGLAL